MKALSRFSLHAAWVRYVTIGTVSLVAALVLLTVSHQPRVHAEESFHHFGSRHGSFNSLINSYFTQDDTGTNLLPNAITPEDTVTNIVCPDKKGCTLQITESATLSGYSVPSNAMSLNAYLDATTIAPVVFNEIPTDSCVGNGCTFSGHISIPITYGPHSLYTLIDTTGGAFLEFYENIYQVYAQ